MVHHEQCNLQATLGCTEDDFAISTILTRTDELIDTWAVGFDKVLAYGSGISIKPNVLYQNRQGLSLINFSRNNVVCVVCFLVVIAINEVDIIFVSKVGLQPLVELIALGCSGVEDTF